LPKLLCWGKKIGFWFEPAWLTNAIHYPKTLLLISLCTLLVFLLPLPAAAETQPERTPLSLELLQKRLRLTFNSNQGKILGNPGEIGKKFFVPTLQGNQSILRNLGQNFRQQMSIVRP
jgi:hypothetical protein